MIGHAAWPLGSYYCRGAVMAYKERPRVSVLIYRVSLPLLPLILTCIHTIPHSIARVSAHRTPNLFSDIHTDLARWPGSARPLSRRLPRQVSVAASIYAPPILY